MNTENDDKVPVEAEPNTPPESPSPSPSPSPPPDPAPEFLAAARAEKAAWKSGKGPGRWATIGCGLGIVVLIGALFAGSSVMRKTVWASYVGANRRLMANLPGDLPPSDRILLKTNLEHFAAYMKSLDDPFPVMGEFQGLVRGAFEDQQITRDEVDELNSFLESKVNDGPSAVPYSMP
jgi:hypothetical protein